MQVVFDLRPPHLVVSQNQRVDPVRILTVLMFLIFVFLSIFNIGFTTMKLRDVRGELDRVTGEKIAVSDNSDRLAVTLTTMRKLRDQVKIYLEFTRQEMPTIEFMAGLEGAVPPGLTITNLVIRPGNVLMKGAALTDQDIIDFGAKLDGMKNIVTKVDAPVTTKGALGSKITSDYAITCNIRPISEIAAKYSEMFATEQEEASN
jgi:hypothetical protein